MKQDNAPPVRTIQAVTRLRLPSVENSLPNNQHKEHTPTIWERLSPESKREVNKLRDTLDK